MPAEIPNYEPSRIVAGTTVTWKKSLADYPADEWTLKYFLRGPSRLDITCTSDNLDFVATIAAVDSAKLKPGRYYLQGRVEKGAEKYLVSPDMLELEVKPGLDTESANFDGRSKYERIVDEIDDLIERTLPNDRAEYEIEGERKRHYSRLELIDLRKHYQQKVNAERRAKRVEAGGDFFQTVRVRLTPVR